MLPLSLLHSWSKLKVARKYFGLKNVTQNFDLQKYTESIFKNTLEVMQKLFFVKQITHCMLFWS